MKRKDFLVLGAATLTLTLATTGCRARSRDDAAHLSDIYVVNTDRFPETSYITGYDKHLLKTTTTALDVRGLGDSTRGYARIRNRVFIPIYGGYDATDNRIAEFDVETQAVRFIQCESEPIDVATADDYLYVAHDDGSSTSTISKIRASNGVTVNKTSLDGIANRIFLSPEGIYAFCDRLITPPNANQNIYFLDSNLSHIKTLTHPYSYQCCDIVQQDDRLIIANHQAAIGVPGGSSLIALHISSGSIQALAAPPSNPVQFVKYGGKIYLLCISGEIMLISDHRPKIKKILQLNHISGACIKDNVLFCIDGLDDQLFAIDLFSRRIISQVKIPRPKYQTSAVLIFPANA